MGCPDRTACAGDSCCPDGSTCPSAYPSFAFCQHIKATDCVAPDAHWEAPPGSVCPDNSTGCGGNACCPDGSTCPSADDDFTGCRLPKAHGNRPASTLPPAVHGCIVFSEVECPGSGGSMCSGNQCCPDGSVCPSAMNDYFACAHSKHVDCTNLPVPFMHRLITVFV